MVTKFSIAFAIIMVVVVFLALYAKGEPIDSSAGKYNFTKLGSRQAGSYSSSDKFVYIAPPARPRPRPHVQPRPPPPPCPFPEDELKFMKLSIWWTTAYCNLAAGLTCRGGVSNRFFIRNFRPMDRSITEEVDDLPGCYESNVVPASEDSINATTLETIWDNLHRYWPSIYENVGHVDHWKTMWTLYGICAGYPNDPLRYFRTAIEIMQGYNFLNILQQARIVPHDTNDYNVVGIRDAIYRAIQVRPQIGASTGSDEVVQFGEIIICSNQLGQLYDCRRRYYGCEQTMLRFPTDQEI